MMVTESPRVDGTAAVNVTGLLLQLQSLSPEDRELLYAQLGISGPDGLLKWLTPVLDEDLHSLQGQTYQEQLLQYEEYRTHKSLMRYIPPILLLLGTFGNMFAFIILMRRAMRKYSTYIYLAVLSITDTLVLYAGLLILWIEEITGYQVRNQTDWTCKIINVLGYTVSDYSVWLILAVTMERFVAVCYPLKAPVLCRRSRALKIIVALFFILFAINSHFFWTTRLIRFTHNNQPVLQCGGSPGYEHLVEAVWPWVDAILYSFLPFIVILILNGLIIHQVVAARRNRGQLHSTREMSSSGMFLSHRPSPRHRQQENSIRLTIMLLTISFAFLLTTLPMNIYSIITAFWNKYARNDLSLAARFTLLRTITELLMYINHSMNFYLYCATGQKFRAQLINLMCTNITLRTRVEVNGLSATHLTANTTAKWEETELANLSDTKLKNLKNRIPKKQTYVKVNTNYS